MMLLARMAACAALLSLLAACGGNTDKARGGDDGAPVAVTTVVLQPRPWRDELQALGTAQARESVTITAKVSDVVTRIGFDSGQRVQAGTVLVDMNSRAQRAEVAAAEVALRDADQQLRRGRELAASQLIAASQLDTLQANRDAAAAALQARRAAVADRVVAAPFAGVLGLRQVSLGALVEPGTAITTLDDDSTIKLDFTVPEASLQALSSGQHIIATSDAWPGREFDGRVATVDSRIDPGTRAVRVRAELPNPDARLRPGMLLQVRVQLPSRQALSLPEIALVQDADQSYVFRVGADGRASRVAVETGARTRGRVEIADGLQAGDRVVVEGAGKLRDGNRVVEAARAGSAAAAGRD